MGKGETDLDTLLRKMEPALRPGRFVYCTFAEDGPPPGVQALCIYREAEGCSAILEEDEALRHDLAHQFKCALITLNVHSDLASVGFVLAVLAALAEHKIPCNVVSAYYHDHLFVPVEQAEEAMAALRRLSAVRHAALPTTAGPP